MSLSKQLHVVSSVSGEGEFVGLFSVFHPLFSHALTLVGTALAHVIQDEIEGLLEDVVVGLRGHHGCPLVLLKQHTSPFSTLSLHLCQQVSISPSISSLLLTTAQPTRLNKTIFSIFSNLENEWVNSAHNKFEINLSEWTIWTKRLSFGSSVLIATLIQSLTTPASPGIPKKVLIPILREETRDWA